MFTPSFPKAFIFDLDGTLVDSVPDLAWALNAALTQMTLPVVSESNVRSWVGNGSVKLVDRALVHLLGNGSLIELSKPLHGAFLTHYKTAFCNNSRLYPGVLALLERIQQLAIPMALVTNKPIAFVPGLLKAMGIEHFFGLLLGGDSLVEKKPSALPLLHAAQFMEMKPQDCLMVGDSTADFKAARAANMPILLLEQGYNQGVNLAQLEPDYLLADVNQLLVRISSN